MPEIQNKGIGTAVLKEIVFENKEKDIVLNCFKEDSTIGAYEKMGFEKIMETKQHYIMKKIKK